MSLGCLCVAVLTWGDLGDNNSTGLSDKWIAIILQAVGCIYVKMLCSLEEEQNGKAGLMTWNYAQ